MSELVIPEDLKVRHNQLRIWITSSQQYREVIPKQCTLTQEFDLIERIARLEAENERLKMPVTEHECVIALGGISENGTVTGATICNAVIAARAGK